MQELSKKNASRIDFGHWEVHECESAGFLVWVLPKIDSESGF